MFDSKAALRVALLVMLGVMFSLPLAGCGQSTGATDAYKIGALFAITGTNAPLGVPERDTALLMEEQINAKGGINGKPIKLVIYDTESDNTKAVTMAKKLIEQDKVLAIIGPTGTGETMAMADTVAKAGVPWLSCASATQLVQPVQKWAFITAETASLAADEVIGALQKKGQTKISILTDTGSFGESGKQFLQQKSPAAGITIVSSESFDPKDTDMTAQLTKIKGSNPQAIVVWGTNPGPAIIAKNAKQLGISIPIYNSHGISNQEFIDLAGDAANGIIFPGGKVLVADGLADSDPQKTNIVQFKKDFDAKYHREANHFGAHAYDAMVMLQTAIGKAGANKAKIRDEIEKIQGFPGIGGVFNMSAQDHNGLSKGSLVMIQIQNGKWTVYKD